MRMRMLDLGERPALEALALEESLLEHLDRGDGEPAWVLWSSPARVIVLGTARPSGGDVFLEHALEDGVRVLRRRSGGGTVVLGPGSPAVTLVDRLSGDIRECYRRFCEVLIAAVARLGLTAEFRAPADLAVGELKIAGLAQRRKKNAALVTASVLSGSMADAAARYLVEPGPEDSPGYRRGRGHGEFMTSLLELGAAEDDRAFLKALRTELEARGAAAGAVSERERAGAAGISEELEDSEWIYRF